MINLSQTFQHLHDLRRLTYAFTPLEVRMSSRGLMFDRAEN